MEKLDGQSVFVKILSGLDWISKPFMIGTFIENDIKKNADKMESNLHRVFDWLVISSLIMRLSFWYLKSSPWPYRTRPFADS